MLIVCTDRAPLTPTLSPPGRGSASRLRRVLRIISTVLALAVVTAVGTASWWIIALGPAPRGEGLSFSTLVVDREDRLLRPYATPEGRWRLPRPCAWLVWPCLALPRRRPRGGSASPIPAASPVCSRCGRVRAPWGPRRRSAANGRRRGPWQRGSRLPAGASRQGRQLPVDGSGAGEALPPAPQVRRPVIVLFYGRPATPGQHSCRGALVASPSYPAARLRLPATAGRAGRHPWLCGGGALPRKPRDGAEADAPALM